MSDPGKQTGPARNDPKPGRHAQVATIEIYLKALMGSGLEAQFETFKQLWKSSHSLRLAIEGFVQKEKASRSRSSKDPSDFDQPDRCKQRGARSMPIPPEFVRSKLVQSYGGLGYMKLLLHLEKHKAGNRDLGVYLFVRAWKRHDTVSNGQDFRLIQLTQELTSQAIKDNHSHFFREIADTVDFLHEEEYKENGYWDHDPDQWWQFHLLLYILEHPKDRYPIREFIKHFKEEVGTNEMPTAKTIRSFCRKNGIALDSRPGAPKKKQ